MVTAAGRCTRASGLWRPMKLAMPFALARSIGEAVRFGLSAPGKSCLALLKCQAVPYDSSVELPYLADRYVAQGAV